MDSGSMIFKGKIKSRCPLQEQFLQRKNARENLDRFIPNRSAMDFDYAHYMVTEGRKGKENPVPSSPSREAYQKHLAEAFNMNRSRILAFKNKPPTLVDPIPREMLTFSHDQPKPPKPRRHIPQSSERTLDAPDILDDFYLNLLDWGASNILAIALGNTVYLWDASNGSTSELFTAEEEDGPVTSISWAPDGRHLAIGLTTSQVQLWDTISNRQLRTLRGGHQLRVGSLAWNKHILTTGGMDGKIINNDVRVNLLASGGGGSDQCIKFWNTHTGACLNSVNTGSQVCALVWSKIDRELLSSHGFMHNQLTLWKYPSISKMAELAGHTSRVLFMAQSPDGCTVASAAGDETLRFWNVFGTPEVAKPVPKTKHEPFAHLSHIR